ncbi:MAG: hypothetical protein JO345_10435 [Streptosporangiaceae bacterium]|nr:hypothetical protein [Streptosporangiaceae bacterium]
MSVRYKSGSRPYRDALRASLQALGARDPRLTELVARDLQKHGIRPRRAWRDAAELSQQQAADRFNQLTGNPRAPMSKRRISDFETWPDGGVRPTMTTLKSSPACSAPPGTSSSTPPTWRICPKPTVVSILR